MKTVLLILVHQPYPSDSGQQCDVSLPSASRVEVSAIEGVCTNRAYEDYIDLVDDDEDDIDENLQDALVSSLVTSSGAAEPSATAEVTAREILQSFQTQFRSSTGTVNTVVVSRRRLLHSVKRVISKLDFSFANPIKVYFSGEDAEDEGGPRREFFTLLMKMVAAEMGIFEGMSQNRILTHNIELLRQGQYHLAGQLVAWSVANGVPGLACLSSYMLKLVCEQSIDDLSAAALHIADEAVRGIVLEILSVKSEVEMTSTVQKWSSQLLDNGVVHQHRLALRDRDTVACDLITNYLKFRISAELSQFTAGLGELWTLFMTHPGALADLFLFGNGLLTFERLRQLYCINRAEPGSHTRVQQEDTIYYFETFLEDCESGSICIPLSQVLSFWTGAEAEPPLGFQTPALVNLDRQLSVEKPLLVDFYDEPGRLPYASTCSLCIWLPLNVAESDFKALLLRSLTECVGFGKV